MKKFYLIILLVTSLVLGSCHDFLQKYPKDVTYANSSQDYNELLVGEGYMDVVSGQDIGEWIHLMDDDVSFMIKDKGNRISSCAFHWWESSPDTEATWKILYKRIGIANVILDGIDEFAGEPGDTYRKVKGEASFLRGAYYYFLVNIYAKPYKESTATSDLGVPLKLDAQVEDRKVSRASVAACYEQIVNDLRNAVVYLKGISQTTNYRANEVAARCLLSRVYLYMGRWDEAVRQCDTILMDRSYRLLDFNTLEVKGSGISGTSPETFFTNGMNNYYSSGKMVYLPNLSAYYTCNKDFLQSYDSRDLRSTCFFNSAMIYPPFPPVTFSGIPDKNKSKDCSDFFLLRLPEAYLNRAEALAMLERTDEAIETIHELRLNRFKTGTIDNEVVAYTGEELVNFIRKERRFEFTFEGHRWFDLRRYAVSPKWPFQTEIEHYYYSDSERDGSVVLGKYDDESQYYVLPIPGNEVLINEGSLEPNPVRDEKTPVR